jgi:UPF0716 protein FxsA
VPTVLLSLAFLAVPIAEIYLIIQVGQTIGAWQTVVLLLVESWLGSLLVRREGRRAWRALREAAGAGRLPSRELADSALVLVGGTLLLTPGFLTDIVAFVLLLPLTRPVARRLLLRWVTQRALRAATSGLGGTGRRGQRGRRAGASRWPGPSQPPGPVIRGEVVDGGGAGGLTDPPEATPQ